MKDIFKKILLCFGVVFLTACSGESGSTTDETVSAGAEAGAGQSGVPDDESARNVVQVAIASKDHSTLVTAVKTAGLVDVLSNVGPFTVFAPVNAAFDALPAGTVESLLKPENKNKLSDILEYHVYVGVIRPAIYNDGMTLNQVNGKNVTLGKQGDAMTVNGAKVLGHVECANGIVYVIDKVLLPE
jgi:uncharacterized surface protein with fasciclin (FAS1) repeats